MAHDMHPQMRRAWLEATPEGRERLKQEDESRKRLIEHATRGLVEVAPGVWVRAGRKDGP